MYIRASLWRCWHVLLWANYSRRHISLSWKFHSPQDAICRMPASSLLPAMRARPSRARARQIYAARHRRHYRLMKVTWCASRRRYQNIFSISLRSRASRWKSVRCALGRIASPIVFISILATIYLMISGRVILYAFMPSEAAGHYAVDDDAVIWPRTFSGLHEKR